jgi:arginyl-tRNA synthetase
MKVIPLSTLVGSVLADAFAAVVPPGSAADPMLRRSDRADFQANGALAVARSLEQNPRDLASRVAAAIPLDGLVGEIEVSGPGFLNVRVTDEAIVANLAARAADARLGVPIVDHPGVTVVDYAQPNVAKEMHVGHLRNSIIGDSVVRILEFSGERVIRRHHIGDWGTQYGMLIQYLIEHPAELDGQTDREGAGEPTMSRLNRLYKASRALFDADETFKQRARRRVVDMQSGDAESLSLWRRLLDESKVYFHSVFAKLDMVIDDADVLGESAYNDMLAETCRLLEEAGVAVRSQGALCVFFDDVKGPDGNPVPLIVRKSDGGFGYAVTDLSALRDRVFHLHATTLLYVVDARQALHFNMVFETARRMGWLTDAVRAVQLAFGTVLGADGKPFKTREGETVRLVDLLDEAIERAAVVVRERSPDMTAAEIAERAAQVGIGAVKYADLSTTASRDYRFDLDQMVSLNGDTSVYLQYAYARIQSILRKATDVRAVAHRELRLEAPERGLALYLDQFADAVAAAAAEYAPHRLAAYLYQLASLYTGFYDQCPVLKASAPAIVENRLFLSTLTARTLQQGLALLGIRTPERL